MANQASLSNKGQVRRGEARRVRIGSDNIEFLFLSFNSSESFGDKEVRGTIFSETRLVFPMLESDLILIGDAAA